MTFKFSLRRRRNERQRERKTKEFFKEKDKRFNDYSQRGEARQSVERPGVQTDD